MKITHAEAWPVTMRLTEPYTIAYESVETTTNVFLKVETDRGITGYGCAAPDLQVTGETATSVMEAVNDLILPRIKGSNSLRSAMLLERLKAVLGQQPSVLAAVDMALHDILGKCSGMPLWKLLGGFRKSIQTSITIGILPEKETVERALYWVGEGFRCLKLKGGLDVGSDIIRVRSVREAVGDKIEIRFDANQGFSVDDALKFVNETKKVKIELLEQPTPVGDRKSVV